jgi:cyclopropane-fatty-acyl-phospholipid synthase
LLQSTLNDVVKTDEEFAADLKTRAIAESTRKANEQHYEVPAAVYEAMLGPWLKYSSGYWPNDDSTLQGSEEAMLNWMCERAELGLPGVKTVLDLGCGWGSAALYIASKYPHLQITCVSNSESQREFIKKKAERMGLTNVTPVTQDANVMTFPENSFDRIVSNEMLEHMKNYQKLFRKIATWLKPKGKIFIHIFTHKNKSYHFEKGWMAETFFTGGTMPSAALLTHFQDDLKLEEQWKVNGKHYSKTLEAWLVRLDQNKSKLAPVFKEVYGDANAWHQNWRLFNMACSELFRFNDGEEWFVSHYRFAKKD